jgi:DNA-binding transcriptional ArsR family regulator
MSKLPTQEILVPLLDRIGLGDDWREVATSILKSRAEGASAEKLRGRIQAFAKRFPTSERDAVTHLLTRPDEERARVIDALLRWYDLIFAADVPRITKVIQREVGRQQARIATNQPAEIFTSLIHGVAFETPANIEHIILAPCMMIAPIIFSYVVDETMTFCYPIEEAAHNAAEQELLTRREMVRLFDALADDTRLRILRHLADRQMYLTELSEHLKLTKATTRHHMIRLRAAGLVTVHNREHLTYFSLRQEALDEPSRTLIKFLGPLKQKE